MALIGKKQVITCPSEPLEGNKPGAWIKSDGVLATSEKLLREGSRGR